MTLQRVPVTNDARQTFDCALDGQLVRLSVWFQPYDAAWYLSLAYQTGTKIVSGRRLATDQNILAGVVSDFHGSITPVGIEATIGRRAWDITHEIIYDSEG